MASLSFNRVLEKLNKAERPLSIKSVAESFGIHPPFSLRQFADSLVFPATPVDLRVDYENFDPDPSAKLFRATGRWRDPGASTHKQAERFIVTIFLPDEPVRETHQLVTSVGLGSVQINMQIRWWVRARNSFGDSKEAKLTVTTPSQVPKPPTPDTPPPDTRPPDTPTPPQITVKKKENSIFTVTGKNFQANTVVHINVTHKETGVNMFLHNGLPLPGITSSGTGEIELDVTLPEPCPSGHLIFGANDGRFHNNQTLWSNFFQIPC